MVVRAIVMVMMMVMVMVTTLQIKDGISKIGFHEYNWLSGQW